MSRTPVLAWSSESTRPVTQIRVIQAQVESILFEPSLEPAEGNVTWHSRIFVEQSGFNVTRALCFVSEPAAGACVGAHPVWGWRFVYPSMARGEGPVLSAVPSRSSSTGTHPRCPR